MRRVQLAGLLSLLVLLVSAGPAAAASPTASTGAASAVTYTKATLSGTVNLQGAPLVSCAFMYGTAAPVSTPVPCSPMPSPSGGATTVTAAITGLTAGTTYQYQLVLTVVGLPPVVQGGIATFATIAAPAVATTAATGIFSTAATLNGTVNPEGATISNCHFIYGTNPAVLSSTAPCSSSPSGTSAVPVSAALSGLSANTPYFYELVATGGVGGETSSVTSSPPQTFTTSNTPPPPPKALTSVAYPIGLTTATVYGYLNGEGVGIGNCHFEYGTTTSYGSTAPCSPSKLATSTANQLVSAALSRLTKDTTYHYQLVVSTAGGTVKGGDASLTTTPPSATTGTATAITQTGATLNGTANPGGNAAYVCGFQYGTTTAYGSTSKCGGLPVQGDGRPRHGLPVRAGHDQAREGRQAALHELPLAEDLQASEEGQLRVLRPGPQRGRLRPDAGNQEVQDLTGASRRDAPRGVASRQARVAAFGHLDLRALTGCIRLLR